MSGKSNTSTSTVSIPPSVLAQYNAVNARANATANTPFQTYSNDPNAFVAPLTSTQLAGISNTNLAAGQAQPYFQSATGQLFGAQNAAQGYNQAASGLAAASAMPVNAAPITGQTINQYLSPYLGDVAASEAALLNQNNQQQQAGQLGNAIMSGAFGGDRAGIAAANLEQQQNLANANIYSGILNTGFNTALNTAQQQQGVNLSAEQANRAALAGAAGSLAGIGNQVYSQGANTASGLAGLGTGAQNAALTGAQAQLAAGSTAQQTEQAGKTALYNQFLQQQAYPFQVDQFLANIAEGTGALSGSTTTTTTPGALFSDERLKEDIVAIGKTNDGQTIYSYRFKGDPKTHIGLLAQEVEKKHPEAVGLAGGYKTVDYKAATADAERKKRGGFAFGGAPEYPYGVSGPYGGVAGPNVSSYVPQANLPVGHLAVSTPPPAQSMASQMNDAVQFGQNIGKLAGTAKGLAGNLFSGSSNDNLDLSNLQVDNSLVAPSYAHGGHVRRYASGGLAGFAFGGAPYSDQTDGPQALDIPNDPNQRSLAVAGAPGSNNNGLGQIASLVGDAASVAKLFMKRGGLADRQHRDTGGQTDDSPDVDKMVVQELFSDLLSAPPQDDDDSAPITRAVQTERSQGQSVPTVPSVTGTQGSPSGILSAIALAEGTGKNPKSSAKGMYQIVDPTFVGAFKQMFPDAAKSMSAGQILALRGTPQGDAITAQMGPFLLNQNREALTKNGIAPTPGNLYLSHFLGPQYAVKVASADPSTPLDSILPESFIKANPSVLAGRSAGDVRQWSANRISRFMGQKKGGRVGYADGGDPTGNDGSDPAIADIIQQAIAQGPSDQSVAAPPPAGLAAGSSGPTSGVAPSVTPQTLLTPDDLTPATNVASLPPPDQSSVPQVDTRPGGLAGAVNTVGQDIGNAAQGVKNWATPPGGYFDRLVQGKADAIIPLLTGIAAMGAAPTRNGLVAFEQGLGAGAQAYQGQRAFEMQQQQLAQQQQRINIEQQLANYEPSRIAISSVGAQGTALKTALAALDANYIHYPDNPTTPWLNLMTGKRETDAQHAARYNSAVSQISSMNLGPNAPNVFGGLGADIGTPTQEAALQPASSAAPAAEPTPVPAAAPTQSPVATAGTPNFDPATLAKMTATQKAQAGIYGSDFVYKNLPKVDESSLPVGERASTLQQVYEQEAQAYGPGSPQAQQALTRWQDTLSGKLLPQDNNGQPFTGYRAYQTALANAGNYLQTQEANRNDTVNAAQHFMTSVYPQTTQTLKELKDIYQNNDLERLAPVEADVIGQIRSVFPSLSGELNAFQSATDAGTKQATLQAIDQMLGSGMGNKAVASALRASLQTVANPSMAAGAKYKLLNQAQAMLDQQHDYYADFVPNAAKIADVSGFTNDWFNQPNHSINAYYTRAKAATPYFKGMSPQEMAADPRPGAAPDLSKLGKNAVVTTPSGQTMYWDPATKRLYRNPVP